MSLSIFFAKQLLRVIGIFNGEKYKYSQEYEDNFKYMDIQEKLLFEKLLPSDTSPIIQE